MANLREYLKDHPVQSIFAFLSSLASIAGLVFAIRAESCKKPAHNSGPGVVVTDTIQPPFHPPQDPDTDSSGNIAGHRKENPGKSVAGDNPVNLHEAVAAIKASGKPAYSGIAVIAAENGKYSGRLTNQLYVWAQKAGASSQSILQADFINNGVFDKIIDHDFKVLSEVSPLVSGYICLLRCNTTFESSSFSTSLTKAKTVWDIVVINMKTAEVIFNDGNTSTASETSEHKATQLNYDEIFKLLDTPKINTI